MWSVGDLVDDIDERSMPLGDRSPAMARWNDEFFAALMNGFFGHGRRTRVLLLDPKEPVQRLTAERAQQIVEAHGKSGFAGIVPFACIRIDDAHDWLNTWLDDWFIERWLSAPATTDALRAVRQMQHTVAPMTQSASRSSAASSKAIPAEQVAGLAQHQFVRADDPLEAEVRNWISEFIADCVERGLVRTLNAAFEQAKQRFPAINPNWFRNVYRPMRPPAGATAAGGSDRATSKAISDNSESNGKRNIHRLIAGFILPLDRI
jgi:hypothetical protein